MLEPTMLFGLNTNVKKNFAYLSDEEILYPVGSVLVIHNFKTRKQRYINLPNPEKAISVISYCPRGKYLAVAERGNSDEKPRIYVYNVETLERKITLGIPFEMNTQEIMCLTFTHDNDYIAALTAGPDYMMYYYNWKNGKIESQTRANNPPSIPGPVTDMAINPKDATIVVFVGSNLFRLLSRSENVWRQYGFQKAQNFFILSVCWLTDDRILAGCKDGKVLIIQSGNLNGIYDMNEVTDINIITTSDSRKDQLKTLSRSKQMSMRKLQEKNEIGLNDVRCCTAVRTGFLFSKKPGEIIYFEKNGKMSYKKSTTFVIKQDLENSNVDYMCLYEINFVSTNVSNDIVSCTTSRNQIYWVALKGHENNTVEFQVFEEPLHHGPVGGLSTCLWKPTFMTYGRFDNSVRIWNYQTKKLLLNQTFFETVLSISLHPTGLYALISFSDKIRYFLVLIHKLQAYRELAIAGCRTLSFSHNGHLFAVECEYDILIYSSITFHKIAYFKGHCQEITSLLWSHNDLILYSSSVNGAIYEWSIEKSSRISDIVLQDTNLKGLVVLPDDKMICISADGRIIEIKESRVITSRKLDHISAKKLNKIILLKNGFCKLMLACSNGVIIALNYPMRNPPDFETYSMHNSSLTEKHDDLGALCYSYGSHSQHFTWINASGSLFAIPIISACCLTSQKLELLKSIGDCFNALQEGYTYVSADTGGNVCIWEMKMANGNEESRESLLTEILVDVDELQEKNENLQHLTSRIVEMVAENLFEDRRKDELCSERIKDVEHKNAHQIQLLKKRFKTVEKEHSMELNRVHLDMTHMKQQHTSQRDQIESHFNAKLLYEFQKYDELRLEMEKIRDECKKQLENVNKTRNSENESHKLVTRNEINNLQQEIIKLRNNLTAENEHFEATLRQMREKYEQKEYGLKTSHEADVRNKDSLISTLRTELGMAEKKMIMFQREEEEFKLLKSKYETERESLKLNLIENMDHIAKTEIEVEKLKQQLIQERISKANQEDTINKMSCEKVHQDGEINELKKLIQENYDQLNSKEDQIYNLKSKIKNNEKENAQLRTEILQLNSRLRSKKKIILDNRREILSAKTEIANFKRDIGLLRDCLQDSNNLKQQVKVLCQKYSNGI